MTEVVPGHKVSWLGLENHFAFTEDKTEWTDTTISFEISEKDGKTEIHFTHHGLVPEYECFDVCSTSWGFYITNTLRNLITTGEGQPTGRDAPQRRQRQPTKAPGLARSPGALKAQPSAGKGTRCCCGSGSR